MNAGIEANFLDDSDGQNWPAYGRTYGEQHFSPLKQINEFSVKDLGLAWYVDLGAGNAATGPVEYNGILYVSHAYSVVMAIDCKTGAVLWTFDPKAAEAAGKKLRQGWGSRGIAYWDGKVYVGTQDGRLIAVDARSGQLVWTVMTTEKDDFRFISGPPRVFDGKVIIGHGGADAGNTRGYVTTYDAQTGRQLWRFYPVPGNPALGVESKAMEMAAKTWAGAWWRYGGGGTVWNAITYDRDSNTVYIGVGNGAPSNRRARSRDQGDNLFLSSIVALDASTGAYKWHYQTNPGESWDYVACMDMELAELSIGGRVRKVLMTAPKNGFFYVIDRQTGRLISAEPFVKVTWATKIDLSTGRPTMVPGARYPNGSTFTMWPGPNGGHSWQAMAFSPSTGLAYIPAMELAAGFTDKGIDLVNWKRTPGNAADSAFKFVFTNPGPPNGTSSLTAWNPVTQKLTWKVATPGIWNGGALATAGNLVFQGQANGSLIAYNAQNGKAQWHFSADAPVISAPITYAVDGQQYLTVVVGMGASGGVYGPLLATSINYRTEKRRVLTFKLGAKAVLPPGETYVFKAAKDESFRPDENAALAGGDVYVQRCMQCHGFGAIAGGVAPDLRASTILENALWFRTVLHDGALISRGMPQYAELPDKILNELRQYIRTAAYESREAATRSSNEKTR